MNEEIKELVQQGKEGKIGALLLVLHKIGGWTVMALACLAALYLIFTAWQTSQREYILDLKDRNKEQREVAANAYMILSQNSDSLNKTAKALEELTEELKRRNSHP